MIPAPSNSLSVAVHQTEPENQKEHRVKENRAIVLGVIRNKNNNSTPTRSEVVHELKEQGFTELQASEALRGLEDSREIFLEESGCFLKVILSESLVPSEFQRQQKLLQNAWLMSREQEDEKK